MDKSVCTLTGTQHLTHDNQNQVHGSTLCSTEDKAACRRDEPRNCGVCNRRGVRTHGRCRAEAKRRERGFAGDDVWHSCVRHGLVETIECKQTLRERKTKSLFTKGRLSILSAASLSERNLLASSGRVEIARRVRAPSPRIFGCRGQHERIRGSGRLTGRCAASLA